MNGLFSDVHGTKLANIQRQVRFFEALYDETKAWERFNSQECALMGYRKFSAQMRLTYLVCTNQAPKLNILRLSILWRCSHSPLAANE